MDPTTGSAATHYAALRRASTARRWLVAIALGGATGLFTNLVLPWPLPLLAALLTVALLALWDRRHGTIADWWPGTRPPVRLAALAARLERHGWTAIPEPAHPHRDRPLAAYVLIGPGGVFVVDHQVWWAPDMVTTDPTTGLLMVGGKPAARRVTAVKGAAAAVTQALAGQLPDDSAVHAVVTVDGPTLDHQRRVADVTILPIADLTSFLHNRDPLLYPTEIATLTAHARRLYTPTRPA